MVLPYPIRPTTSVLDGIDAVRLRRDLAPVESGALALANPRPVITSQAAIVEFGAQAMSLARSTLLAAPDATLRELGTDANAALRPDEDASEALFVNRFGPDGANAPRESGFFRADRTSAESM